ncbi:MAG: hypothetical protein AAB250_10350 [Bdellovibrionota bacterium]
MRSYALQQYVLWTFTVVVTMGAVVLFTLAQPPSPLQTKLRRPSSIATESSRRPAAAAPVFSSSEAVEGPQAAEMTLPCEGKSDLAKAVTQVRLSGASCLAANAKRDIVSVELLNDANGFSATVFYPTPRTFTTDYVALNDGENKIKILITYANGEREERAVVVARK